MDGKWCANWRVMQGSTIVLAPAPHTHCGCPFLHHSLICTPLSPFCTTTQFSHRSPIRPPLFPSRFALQFPHHSFVLLPFPHPRTTLLAPDSPPFVSTIRLIRAGKPHPYMPRSILLSSRCSLIISIPFTNPLQLP